MNFIGGGLAASERGYTLAYFLVFSTAVFVLPFSRKPRQKNRLP